MHLSDRVIPLDEPIGLGLCLGAGLVAAAGLWTSARRLRPEEIPRIGMIAVWIFAASSVRIPIGGAALHLGLYGLAGFFLRGRLILATVPALVLQMLLFGHGGWTTLGVNVVVTTVGGFAGWAMAVQGWLPLRWRAFLAGFLGIAVGATLTAEVLILANYPQSILAFWALYVPPALIEGIVTCIAVETIARLRPELCEMKSTQVRRLDSA